MVRYDEVFLRGVWWLAFFAHSQCSCRRLFFRPALRAASGRLQQQEPTQACALNIKIGSSSVRRPAVADAHPGHAMRNK